ncbi:hypothetical protein [Streptomyces sp. NBC_00728]|uniref:hypothetical protein n=1 Tax=Streptomyces sp. NBC_00728 TaxID=2903676 RepID=UPI0038674B8E
MSRLSREQKRELKRQRSAAGAGGQPTTGMTPIEVHVPASADAVHATGAPSGATVGGMPVVATPGQTVQGAILNYLHRLALATGHPVLATIHDERIGYVVPLQVYVDGSSQYTAEPVQVAPPAPPVQQAVRLPVQSHEQGVDRRPHLPAREHGHPSADARSERSSRDFAQPPSQEHRPQPPAPPLPPAPPSAEVSAQAPETPGAPRRDKATYVLRAVPEPQPIPEVQPRLIPEPQPQPSPEPQPQPRPIPEPQPQPRLIPEPHPQARLIPEPQPQSQARPIPGTESGRPSAPVRGSEAAPALPPTAPPDTTPGPDPVPAAESAAPGTPTPSTFVLRAVPEPRPLPGAAPTHVLRAVPESAGTATPAPTGEFGPVLPLSGPAAEQKPAPGRKPVPDPIPAPDPVPAPGPEAAAPEWQPVPEPKAAAFERKPASAMDALSLLAADREPDPKPTPVRGFDAVAEAVLAPSGQEPAPERDAASAFLAEPVARINEAVKMGRIEAAAGMAERAVAEAAQSLGQEHPEVLKLRELTAYIAYLAGDALRSFHLSLDLARVRRRHRDTGAAYGNVQSAAAAWRAVRDPVQGLHLGRDLIGVWTELTAEGGPAADDLEQLESARTRMGRLAERARVAADTPYARPPRAQGE